MHMDAIPTPDPSELVGRWIGCTCLDVWTLVLFCESDQEIAHAFFYLPWVLFFDRKYVFKYTPPIYHKYLLCHWLMTNMKINKIMIWGCSFLQILKISSLKMVISRNINRDDLNLPPLDDWISSYAFGKLDEIHDNQKFHSNIIFKEK